VIVVVDALKNLASLLSCLIYLNEQGIQLMVYGSLKLILTAADLMVYRFPKADVTTTTVVFADIDNVDPLVLTLVRDRNPYKDMESFPGGFVNVQLESVEECAAREVMEEAFANKNATGEDDKFTYRISAADMVLIDVRSNPDRDERGHVIDHGYAWFIPRTHQKEVMSRINAGDDAKAGSARFVRASELLQRPLAFDHTKLFHQALKRLDDFRASHKSVQKGKRTRREVKPRCSKPFTR
jgi:ADP-ribose pyrophosphatase YjhB (NUDIX family)